MNASGSKPSDREIRQILETAKTVAVVGLSDKPDRDSYKVAKYLQEHGYRIIPVNPTVDQVLGEKSYASVTDIPEQVDVVDVFRKSGRGRARRAGSDRRGCGDALDAAGGGESGGGG